MRTPLPHVPLLTTRGVLSCVRGVRRKGMVVTSVDGKVPANSDEAISMVTSKSRPLTLGAPSPLRPAVTLCVGLRRGWVQGSTIRR